MARVMMPVVGLGVSWVARVMTPVVGSAGPEAFVAADISRSACGDSVRFGGEISKAPPASGPASSGVAWVTVSGMGLAWPSWR